jgi:integrase
MTDKRNPNPGIEIRHARACATRTGAKRCSGSPTCNPSYLATVATGRRGGKIRKTFASLSAAKAWQADQRRALHEGADLSDSQTVGAALDAFVAGLADGTSRAKGKVAYKPSTAVSYASNTKQLHAVLGGELAATRMRDVTPQLVQRVVDELAAEGSTPSTVRNIIMPLRKVVLQARKARTLVPDPFVGLDLPATAEKPLRAVSVEEAGRLLDALDYPDRAFLALAFYAGLRSGEISAVRWCDITAPDIHVHRTYCGKSHTFTTPKSRQGTRHVVVPAQLFAILDEYRATLGNVDADALVFPTIGGAHHDEPARPIHGRTVSARAAKAWKRAGIDGVKLQEARHTYASWSAAHGVAVYRLSEYMGHASIELTMKRYTHLYDADRVLDAQRMTDGVARGDTRGRLAQLDA